MAEIRVVSTAELDSVVARQVRALMDAAFDGEFSDDDWDHTLGGLHALAFDDGAVVAHGAVVQRRLLHRGRALRTGYVEGVAVHAAHRGRGLGAAVMDRLEEIVRRAYTLGALSASEEALTFYAARGWLPWRGATYTLGPSGPERTPDDDDAVFVLPVAGGAAVDTGADLFCDWRDGDPW